MGGKGKGGSIGIEFCGDGSARKRMEGLLAAGVTRAPRHTDRINWREPMEIHPPRVAEQKVQTEMGGWAWEDTRLDVVGSD